MTTPSPLEAIFFAALEKGSPEERGAYLDEACADDRDLRDRVERMLAAQVNAGSFLEVPAQEMDRTIDQPITEKPGTQIGPYKLLQQIGEGGMGVVYMAEQKEPVKRRVALKIIKPGMDTRQVIARFEAERQALAMMDHPNIAKVLDAGATESGRPYFVMELVNGLPVTKYCDEQHLTPKERLELFVPICQAMQHAHQKGIIHRDLKPSNILVALYDGQAVPKIIDFGVAKATSQTLTEKTMFTQLGQVVGTLEYMSPEQAERNQLDIDTRSDIYSLGVVLYELLTGETPFDRARLRSAAFDEMLRIIREEEPSKPSAKVSSSQSLPSIAANRRIEPARLGSTIRGELDWIVMKSLEKDRKRRYQTASDMAEDVERYLNDDLVKARPPSVTYRFSKFARRNRGFLTTATLVFAAMLIGTGVSTWQAVRAVAAQKESESIIGVLEKLLVEIHPGNSLQWDVSFRTVLDQTAAKIDKMELEPLVEARIRFLFGDAYLALGEYTKAKEQLIASEEMRRKELGPDHPETVRAAALKFTIPNPVSLAIEGNDTILLARNSLESQLDRCRDILGENDPMTLRVQHALAWHLGVNGLFEEATRNQDHRKKAHEHYTKSIEEFTDVHKRRRKTLGEAHADTLGSAVALARVYNYQASFENKEPFEKAVRITTEVLQIMKEDDWPEEHPITLETKAVLGRAYHWLGREQEGLKLSHEVYQGRLTVLGQDHAWTGYSRNWLGSVYFSMNDMKEAEPYLAGRGELRQDFLILCKLALNKPEEAEELARRELKLIKPGHYRWHHWQAPLTNVFIAKALIAQNKELGEAERRLKEASESLENNKDDMTFDGPQNESNDPILAVRRAMVDLYTALGKPEEAKKLQAELDAWPAEKAKLLKEREASEQQGPWKK